MSPTTSSEVASPSLLRASCSLASGGVSLADAARARGSPMGSRRAASRRRGLDLRRKVSAGLVALDARWRAAPRDPPPRRRAARGAARRRSRDEAPSTTEASSGWAKRTRSRSRTSTPASSASISAAPTSPPGCAARSRTDVVGRGQGRGGEHEVPGALRQAAQALRHELLDVAGHRKRLTQACRSPWRASACAISRAKKGLPPETSVRRARVGRVRVSPSRDRTSWCRPARRASGRDALDALRRKRSRKPERELDTDGRAAGEQQAGASGQPAHGELERLPRRRVEPLHVVDRDEQRLPLGEGGEHADQRRRRRACVCRFVALAPQQRRRESPFLDGRQRSASLVEGRADEIRERGIRQRRLALRRTRLEDAERPRLGGAHGLEPHRGLADPCLALDHERDRPGVHVVEEASDEGELRVPTDDGAVHDASHAVAG